MQFGREVAPGPRELDLPPADRRWLALQLPAGELELSIGAPLWGHRGWAGRLFPRGASAAQMLRGYSARYSSVELNSTFYALPDPARVEAWVSLVPPGFRFCLKVPRSISHERPCPADFAAFRALTEAFGSSLGTCFYQAPPSAGPEALPELQSRLEALGPGVAVELRHPAWFHGQRLIGRAWSWLQEAGLPVVVTDAPGRREVLHQSLAGDSLLVRFLGEEGAPEERQRLRSWAARLPELRAGGLRRCHFFLHQQGYDELPELLDWLEAEVAQRLGHPKRPSTGQVPLFSSPAGARRPEDLAHSQKW